LSISQQVGASSLNKPGVCTSATRPATPYEGQMIYETDTDLVRVWNGSAWKNVAATAPTQGTVLQVVTNSTTTQVNVTTSYLDTNLTASIAPQSSSSTILISVSQGLGTSAGIVQTIQLLRGSTVVTTQGHCLYSAANFILGYCSFNVSDSPATTSSITYKTQVKVNSAGNNYCNFNDGNGIQKSTIVLMEISA